MSEKVVPMIHVPDVRAAVDWYESIGFNVLNTYGNERGGLSFALLSFGTAWVMFNQGGLASSSRRREVDLYVYSDDVEAVYQRLRDRVEVVEGLHDTFYGMREFIIRDLNRFWITFGQPTIFDVLITAVREGDTKALQAALESDRLKPEMLTAALAVASNKSEIAEMLKQAGAVPPAEVDLETLQSYAGRYRGEKGFEVVVTVENGQLFATGDEERLRLIALDRTTFKPIEFDDALLRFNINHGKVTGFQMTQGSGTFQLQRVDIA